MILGLLGWLFIFSSGIFASGAWYQTPQQIISSQKAGFTPRFVLLKAGVFSKSGHLSLPKEFHGTSLKTHCSTSVESIAWITHRLSPGETLSELSGKTLGQQIGQSLEQLCFSAVELDIEPLSQAEPWLEPFLKGVRSSLSPKFKLRLAIPVLSPQNLPGHFWSLRDGVKALSWVDGLDVMAYDSGVKSPKDYAQLLKNTFFFIMELNKTSPEKKIILGLPAYNDKTTLHSKNIENLEMALATLRPFTTFQLKPLCEDSIRLAYYAGWTLSESDFKNHQQIEEWKNGICKKGN